MAVRRKKNVTDQYGFTWFILFFCCESINEFFIIIIFGFFNTNREEKENDQLNVCRSRNRFYFILFFNWWWWSGLLLFIWATTTNNYFDYCRNLLINMSKKQIFFHQEFYRFMIEITDKINIIFSKCVGHNWWIDFAWFCFFSIHSQFLNVTC